MVIHGTYGLDPYSKMFHKRENLPKEFVYPNQQEEEPKKVPALFVVRTLEPASNKNKSSQYAYTKSGDQICREYIAYSDMQVEASEKQRQMEEQIRKRNKLDKRRQKKKDYLKKKKANMRE